MTALMGEQAQTAGLKLTANQKLMLGFISDPAFRITGLSVYGPREWRTANSLHRKGLAVLSVTDHLTITPEGRAALTKTEERT